MPVGTEHSITFGASNNSITCCIRVKEAMLSTSSLSTSCRNFACAAGYRAPISE